MSTTRSLRNRSSRFSSPATFAASTEATPSIRQTVEGQGSTNGSLSSSKSAAWVEPAVRNGVPSFEDTKGLERVGVLEHMQPLGTGPNPKLLQRLKLTIGNRSSLSARETPGYSEGVASPNIEPAKHDVASPIDPEILLVDVPPLPGMPILPIHLLRRQPQQSDQENMTPESVSPPRGRPARREVEEMKHIPEGTPLFSSFMKSSTRTSRASPRNASIQEHVRDEKMRVYLEEAIRRAEREGRTDLAAGLRTVIDEVKSESKLLLALEAIIQNGGMDVSREHYKTFKHHIKKGIRHYRRSPEAFTGRDYGLLSSQPQTVGYLSQWPTKKRSPNQDSINNKATPEHPLVLIDLPTTYSDETSLSKLSLHSPSTLDAPPTDFPIFLDSRNVSNKATNSTPRKRRYSSASSTSSLSSAQSIAPPTPGMTKMDRQVPDEGRATRSSASQRQDTALVAPNDRTRFSGTVSSQQPLILAKPSDLTLHNTNLPINKKIKLTHTVTDEEIDEIEHRRKFFENQTVYDYNYDPPTTVGLSDLRPQLDETASFHRPRVREGPPPPIIHSNPLIQTAEVLSPTSQQGDFGGIDDIARRRGHDDAIADDQSSLSDAISVAPPTNARPSIGTPNQRASTPRAAKETRRQRHPRTMISPNKPRGTAGTPGPPGTIRPQAGRDVTDVDSNMEEPPDNEDRCRSCRGGGHLVCCDSCPNSFHLDCLEPPLDAVPQGDWDCPECVARKRPKHQSVGLMDTLVSHVSGTYPRAYLLPTEIREYYEYVKTGEDGQYEEVPIPVTNKRGAARPDHHGALRPPNYREIRDNKGNVRYCYKCGLTTGGDREMVPCDFCPHEWHLDCLDPPLATPPKRFIDGKAVANWHCPLHVENDYRAVARAVGAEPGELGRQPRLRRPKTTDAKTSSSHVRQPNNGVIDVVLEPEEQEINIKEREMRGEIQRIPEKDIILDFIDRARRDWYLDHAVPRENAIIPNRFHARSWLPNSVKYQIRELLQPIAPAYSQRQVDDTEYIQPSTPDYATETADPVISSKSETHTRLYSKTFVEQNTALNLLALAIQPAKEVSITSGKQAKSHTAEISATPVITPKVESIDNLIQCLIVDAPPQVTEMIAVDEEEQLLQLQKLLEQRIKIVQAHKRPHGHIKGYNKGTESGSGSVGHKVNGTLGHNHEH